MSYFRPIPHLKIEYNAQQRLGKIKSYNLPRSLHLFV